MEITGHPDGPPTKVGPGIGDLFTATLNCIGILAAINHREHTGEGQYVDTGMYDAMISLTERAIYQHSYTGEPPTRRGNAHPTLFPYDAFETADGYAVIAAFGTAHWHALCEAMDRPDLAAAYATAADRLESRDHLRKRSPRGPRTSRPTTSWELSRARCRPHRFRVRRRSSRIPTSASVRCSSPWTNRVPTAQSRSRAIRSRCPRHPRATGRAPLLDEHRAEILGEGVERPADD